MSKTNKILITTGIFPPDIGGPASHAGLLGRELSKRDVSVTVLTYSSVLRSDDDETRPFKIVRVWRGTPKILRHFVYFLKALSLAREADVILALNAVSAGLPALWAAKIRKKRFFVKIVGDYAWETAVNSGKTFLLIDDFQKTKRRGWAGILHKYQVKVCKKADGVIVPSNYLANMVKNWGVPEGKIKVIYNGVDFKPLEIDREEARKKIGIAGNIILSVGRLVPWKGFRMLIKIMPKLFEINQFFRLVIVGDGPEKKILESIVKNMHLENKGYLVGKKSKEELALLSAAADIFVLNTAYEGFSHQILEAMAAGLPVITTAVGGNREIIRQGENGFMVKYNDEFNLIEAIKTVWQMGELRTRFIEEGKKTVEHFSFEKMINETAKILI
jgi:glycosyltransferase involved in cell wall biosynthesis